MHIAFTSSKPHDRSSFAAAADELGLTADFEFFDFHLDRRSAPVLAGREVVCIFVNDHADREVLQTLHAGGTRLLLLRSAGYNHVDLKTARELGIQVANVPAYSPHAVAEHAVGLLLALNRKIHRAWLRVRDGNFALDGLIGLRYLRKTGGRDWHGPYRRVFRSHSAWLRAAEFMAGISETPWVIFLWINLILFVLGTFMDMGSTILICTPIFLPIAQKYGMDPTQFGMVMLINCALGLNTPPVGTTQFVGCAIGGVTVGQVMKSIWPFSGALLVCLLLVTYVPAFSLTRPQMFMAG